jgi:Ca2+-binding RTX toxin-like protein
LNTTNLSTVNTLDASGLTTSGVSATSSTAADTITGSAQADTFTYLATTDLFASAAAFDSIVGGLGTDILSVGPAGGATAFAIANSDVWGRISGVETIKAVANSAAVTIALDVTAETAGVRTVDISLATTVNTHTIDVAEYVTAGVTMIGAASSTTLTGGAGPDTITGAGASDTIVGGAGADSIVGGAGSDSINGGTGADILTGGTDTDTFLFTPGETGIPSITNFETITDFTTASDLIKTGTQLVLASTATAASGMAGLGAANGAAATFNAADTTFAQHIAAIESALSGNTNTAHEIAMWKEGSDTYVFIADGVAGVGANDILIKLTGVDNTASTLDIITLSGAMATLA